MSGLLSSHLSTETSLAGSVPKAAFKCRYTLFILFKLLHTADSMYAYIYCKERLERDWSGLVQNEQKVWLSDWIVNTPRYDYKSTCNAKKKLDRIRYFVERGAFAKQVEKLRTIIHFRMGPYSTGSCQWSLLKIIEWKLFCHFDSGYQKIMHQNYTFNKCFETT